MPFDVPQLLKMSQQELDDLFKASPAGPIPDGPAKGTAIVAPGTVWSPEIAEFISYFIWEGKTFDAAHGVLTNRLLSFGRHAIRSRSLTKIKAGSTAKGAYRPRLLQNLACGEMDPRRNTPHSARLISRQKSTGQTRD